MKGYNKLMMGCVSMLPVVAMAAPDFGQLADNIRGQYDNIVYLLTATTYVLGIWYILQSILMLRNLRSSLLDAGIIAQQRRQYWYQFFIGIALLFFPSVLAIIEATIFGSFNAVTAGVGGIIYS